MKKVKLYVYTSIQGILSNQVLWFYKGAPHELPLSGHTADLESCPMEPSLSWAFLTGRKQPQRQWEWTGEFKRSKVPEGLLKGKKIYLVQEKSVQNYKSWYIQLHRKYWANHRPGWYMGNIFLNYKTWTAKMLAIQLKFVSFKEIDLHVKKELKYMLSIWHFSYTRNTREQIYFLFYSNKALMNWRKNSYSYQGYS